MSKDMSDARKLYADMKKKKSGKKKAKAAKEGDDKVDANNVETTQPEVLEQPKETQQPTETTETTEPTEAAETTEAAEPETTESKEEPEEPEEPEVPAELKKGEEAPEAPEAQKVEEPSEPSEPSVSTENAANAGQEPASTKDEAVPVKEEPVESNQLEVPDDDDSSVTDSEPLMSKADTPTLVEVEEGPQPKKVLAEPSAESERIMDELLSGETVSSPHRTINRASNSHELNSAMRESVISSIEANPNHPVTEPLLCEIKPGSLQRLEDDVNDKAEQTVEKLGLSQSPEFSNLVAENKELKLRINELEQQVNSLKRQLNEAQQEQLEISVTTPPGPPGASGAPGTQNSLNPPSDGRSNKDNRRIRASSFVEADLTSGNEQGANDLEDFRDFKLDLRDWHVSRGEGPVIQV